MIKVNRFSTLISIFESLCILLNTELMLPQVTKSLLDLEDLIKGDLKSIVQNAILLIITLKILKVILIEKVSFLEIL